MFDKNTKRSPEWLFSCGGAIEALIHKEMWAQTFSEVLNEANTARSWLIVRKGKWASEYALHSDLPEIFKVSEKFLDPDFLNIWLRSAHKARLSFSKTVDNFGLQRLTNESATKEWFETYLQIFRQIALHYWPSQPEFLYEPEQRLRALLAKTTKSEAELEDSLGLLTTPTEETIIDRENRALSKLRKNISEELLEKHARQFPWLFLNTFNRETIHNFLLHRAQQKELYREPNVDSRQDTRNKKREKLLQKIDTPEVENLSRLFRTMSIERLELKGRWAGATYLFFRLFERIAEHVQTDVADVLWTWRADEIREALTTRGFRVPKEETSRRLENYVLLLEKGALRFCSGNEARQLIQRLLGKEIFADPAERQMRGMCASKGRVSGTVRVVRVESALALQEDTDSFKKGEIMVVTMTQPSMLPLIQKAAGVITEEGGLTSHATIICRERGIPCIVGVNSVTRTLHTGDNVVMDATKGIIDIIQR